MLRISLFTLFIALSSAVHAIVIPPGTTATYGNFQSINDDIIVSPSAVLIIDGLLEMGPGKKIIVRDRGRVISSGGTVTKFPGLGFANWGGIQIDPTSGTNPTTGLALSLENVNFHRADMVLDFGDITGVNQNRKVSLSSCLFEDNAGNIYIDGGSFGTSAVGNEMNFTNCEFGLLNGTTYWATWLKKIANVHFVECNFHDVSDGGGITLHFNSLTNSTILDCTFENNFMNNIAMHGLCSNVNLSGNSFIMQGQSSGIDFQNGAGGNCTDITMSNNYFYANDPTGTVGIYGSLQSHSNWLIESNVFNNMSEGIIAGGFSGGPGQILKNRFYYNNVAIHSVGNNAELIMTCNEFIQGNVAIKISTSSVFITNLPVHLNGGTDPGNVFIGNTLDIQNTSTFTWLYYVSTQNAYPLSSFSGPVTPQSCFRLARCSTQRMLMADTETAEELSFGLYPNPAVETVQVTVEQVGTLQLIDLTGKIVLEEWVQEGDNPIEISALASGVYTVKLSNAQGILTDRLIIK